MSRTRVPRCSSPERPAGSGASLLCDPVVPDPAGSSPVSRHNARWWWDLPAGGDAGRTPKTLVTTLVSGLLPPQHGAMRYESSVTSISWIPSDAVTRDDAAPTSPAAS